jgi:hypothetical protein
MLFNVRYAVVFQRENLQEEAVLEDLRKYGEVVEHYYDDLVSDDGDKTPVMIVIVELTIGKAFSLKMDYNCVQAEDSEYVLFPMESMEAKRKVLKLRGAL